MGNTLVNTRDQRFILYEQIGIEKLFSAEKYADYSMEVVDMMLNEAEKMAVDVILPTYDVGDKEGAVFADGKVTTPACFHPALKTFNEAGWGCAIKDPEVGGQNLPLCVWSACAELFDSANFAFMMYPGLTLGAAGLIEKYGTEEQKNTYMYKMFSGEWGGTMCLTEPGAGSDVGATRTTAKRLPDGSFKIEGTKSFISAGDSDFYSNIIHPVLARIEGDPPGTGGISIFIVPKFKVNEDGSVGESNDVVTGGIEHKMGIKASATATLNFGENGKCIGYLLGEERAGMKVMFNMMNEARLEVGMQGLGHATASLEHAVQYAKERIQSRHIMQMTMPDAPAIPIIQHPDIRRSLLWMKSHVEGMRAMNYFAGFCIDMEETATDAAEKAKWKGFVEILTPVIKAYCSDKACEICSLGMDVYGGYGYIQEYPMEQYLRDCKIATLYEGTNYIQSLDLVGRKMGANRGMNVMNLFGEINQTIAKAKENAEMKDYAVHLEDAYNAVVGLSMQFAAWGKSSSVLLPILNARPFLMILGDLVVGWQLLQGAIIAAEKLDVMYAEVNAGDSIAKKRALARENGDAAFYQGKLASAKYFACNVLPAIAGRCKCITLGDKTPIEMLEDSFAV
ncbi:MAG: acyl-CoA dehydrogenase [Deltaproteobacteria bacterium]|nr:acyl-CoA dehydrogenase [Deltaproteobacteria bacterium]MBN2845576.1 acyl-CoA dehydrogenase [Deltaproteobacteria bacterium]